MEKNHLTGKDKCLLQIRYLKVCDDGTLIQILCFWTLSIVLFLSKTPSYFYLKTQRFEDWSLTPSSGKTYSVGLYRTGPNELVLPEDGNRIESPKRRF
jgi:hypothetical protein